MAFPGTKRPSAEASSPVVAIRQQLQTAPAQFPLRTLIFRVGAGFKVMLSGSLMLAMLLSIVIAYA